MQSALPTVTSVRIKSVMTGSISTFYDTINEVVSSEVTEDNLLQQLKRADRNERVLFFGDDIWDPMFGSYFDESRTHYTGDTTDLDSSDASVAIDLMRTLQNHSNFKLLLAHVIGIDSAGHTFDSQDAAIEKKIKDVESVIKHTIDVMDQDTTLIVFGDHGMTSDGNHGGDSLLELSTVFFAY